MFLRSLRFSIMGSASSNYSKPHEIASVHFQGFETDLPSQAGRVVAITGCTSGTGLVAALTAAKKGAHVVLLNRRSSRSEAALELVKKASPNGTATAIDCDLQSLSSVRSAIDNLNKAFSDTGIDVLCMNAGVMALIDKATEDGYDIQMQTNHLSHFLLAKDCMNLLNKAASLHGEARIVNHSSAARKFPSGALSAKYFGKNGGNLGGDGASMVFGGARWQRYHQTKLANAVFTVALSTKLRTASSKVKVLCAAPGLAATNLQVTTNADGGMADTWIMKYAQSAEDGTMPLLTCMFAPEAPNGAFYEPHGMTAMKGKPVQKDLSKESNCNSKAQEMLWTESEKACGEWKF